MIFIAYRFPPTRISERGRAAAGKSGIMSRLFGTTEPDIVRDHATRALDHKIHTDRDNIDRAKRDLELVIFLYKHICEYKRYTFYINFNNEYSLSCSSLY